MYDVNFIKDPFESIPDYRKVVIIKFLIKNDVDLVTEVGFLKNDINCLCLKFKKKTAQNEDFLDYIKNEEESINERILKK